MLYDAYDRPVQTGALTKEVSAPTLTGIRSIWDETVASGLTPSRLAGLLIDAADGDPRSYLTLAEEMEERDLHYAGVLGVRKRAVCGLPVSVESASDETEDVKIADEIRVLIRKPAFDDLIEQCMDGLGKGYSANEIMWRRDASKWFPAEYKWRDPRFFIFDRATKSELRLLTDENASEGEAIAPYKFIVHYPRLKMGIPIRNGIARIAAWAYMFKNYGVKDWLAFCEIFGMPFRLGKYGTGARQAEIDILSTAVANIGTDAAAVVPKSMEIEFVESAKSTGGDTFFKTLADWFDYQVAFCILGQSGTTHGTPGRLGNDDTMNEVRLDIRNSDARQLQKTLNRDLVKPFVDLNFGPRPEYPNIVFETAESEDISVISAALEKLVPLGLRVEASVVRDMLGLPDPPDDAECLSVQSAPAPQPGPAPETESAPNRMVTRASSSGMNAVSQGRFTPEQEALEGLAEKSISKARAALEANEAAFVEAVQNSASYEEAMDKVLSIYPRMNVSRLQDMVGRAMFGANVFGQSNAKREVSRD